MNIENKVRIEIILTGIVASLLLILLVIMATDIMDFYNDKETYSKVYELHTNEKNWEWQYLSRWAYIGPLIFIGLTIVTLRIIKKNNETIKKVNWLFLLFFFCFSMIQFYRWMKTGDYH